MNTILLLIVTAACFGVVVACRHYEKKSRKYYTDRALIYTAGLWTGFGLVGCVAVLYSLLFSA